MSENKLIAANIDESTGIAWLTLNRPEKKNALSIALLKELAELLRGIAGNEKIRCVVESLGKERPERDPGISDYRDGFDDERL